MKISVEGYQTKVPEGMKPLFIGRQFNSMSLSELEYCFCCGREFKPALTLKSKDPLVPYLSRGFCDFCGYFGAKRTLSSDWVENYYLNSWTNTQRVLESELNSELKNTRPFDTISKYLTHKDASILDAGAGYGSSLRVFLEHGYSNVEALELSKRRVEVLKTRYKVKVDNIPLERLGESQVLAGRYDVIYLWHVFEHLSKLSDCLESIRRATKQNGLLYIAVPNFPEEHFTNLVNLHVHMHTFQNFTLHYLLSRYGFELVEEVVNFDGGGIRALYRKTDKFGSEGDLALLPDRQKILDLYNEKIFKDFQLMFLIHQSPRKRKNVLMTFHYNSSFAGTDLIRYPIFWFDLLLFKLLTALSDELKLTGFIGKVKNKICNGIIRWLGLAQGTFLLGSIEGLPADQYPFRGIFGKSDFISIDFIHNEGKIKLWME